MRCGASRPPRFDGTRSSTRAPAPPLACCSRCPGERGGSPGAGVVRGGGMASAAGGAAGCSIGGGVQVGTQRSPGGGLAHRPSHPPARDAHVAIGTAQHPRRRSAGSLEGGWVGGRGQAPSAGRITAVCRPLGLASPRPAGLPLPRASSRPPPTARTVGEPPPPSPRPCRCHCLAACAWVCGFTGARRAAGGQQACSERGRAQ